MQSTHMTCDQPVDHNQHIGHSCIKHYIRDHSTSIRNVQLSKAPAFTAAYLADKSIVFSSGNKKVV